MFKVYSTLTLAAALIWGTTGYAQDSIKLTDPEIAHAAVVANQIDVDYAAIALKKTKTKSVVEYAEMMNRDHKAVIEKATNLVKKLNVTPKDNDLSKSLMSAADSTKKVLESHSGANFDKAYIDNEVAYHKAVINSVETVLIPQATNNELKDLLETVLPNLKGHLLKAETIQKELNGNGTRSS